MSTLCQELRQVLYKRMRDVREGHIRWLAEGRRPALTLGVSQLLCRCQKGRNANKNDTKTQSNGVTAQVWWQWMVYNPAFVTGSRRIRSWTLLLAIWFKASLGYKRPCHKSNNLQWVQNGSRGTGRKHLPYPQNNKLAEAGYRGQKMHYQILPNAGDSWFYSCLLLVKLEQWINAGLFNF